MRHRAHDSLFAAAGVTAALSLIGTGVTVLKGTVFHFDHWPLVAGDHPRRLQLPVAPIPAAPAGQDAARRGLRAPTGAGVAGGLPGALAAAGGAVSSLSFTLSGGAGSPATDVRFAGTTPRAAGVTLDGSAASLGATTTAVGDGSGAPIGGAPTLVGDPRVASVTDTDKDGVPDTWQQDHGAPSAATDLIAGAGATARDAVSAFRPQTPTVDPQVPAQPAPEPTAPAPVDKPPADVPAPTDGGTQPAPADPAPAQPAPADPAPAPADPAPAPADPAPAQPAPAVDPAPAETAPATDPAPAAPAPADPAPAPAPAPVPAAPADPAPPSDPAPAPAAPAPAAAAPAGQPAAG